MKLNNGDCTVDTFTIVTSSQMNEIEQKINRGKTTCETMENKEERRKEEKKGGRLLVEQIQY